MKAQLAGGIVVGIVSLILYLFMKKKKLKTFIDTKKTVPLMLHSKTKAAKDCFIFRFKLPSEEHIMNLPIGNHVCIHKLGGPYEIKRPYTPVSLDHEIGYMDLAIKIYFSDQKHPGGGLVSNYINDLPLGDYVHMSAPYGRIKYLGYGKFTVQGQNPITVTGITMIAGGTGITPMFQILKYMKYLGNDRTKISLIYANRAKEDILLFEELNEIQNSLGCEQFRIYHILCDPPEDWDHGDRKITKEVLSNNAVSPSDTTLALCCGRPMINQIIVELLESIGYSNNRILCF